MGDAAHQRYHDLMHGIQSGIAFLMNHRAYLGDPKHLRVGINCAQVAQGALAKVLVDKGVITMDEYEDALVWAAEREVKMYENEANEILGVVDKIHFK